MSTSSTSFSVLEQSVQNFLSTIEPEQTLFIAYSGGLDSTVLLHLLVQSRQKIDISQRLIALHVNHHLQPEADSWQAHSESFALGLGVEFHSLDIEVDNTRRKGIEAAARAKRYQALFQEIVRIDPNGVLLTAHHQRDQAETVLLNLSRGAGVNGLAAMQACAEHPVEKVFAHDSSVKASKTGVTLRQCRPLLNAGYQSLVDYAKQHKLSYVEDASNEDVRFARNLVRHRVLPELCAVWPEFENKLAKTATYMQEAVELLDEYAAQMLQQALHTHDFIELSALSNRQRKNLLRYWFKRFWPQITLSEKHYAWILQGLDGYHNSANQSYCYRLSDGELRLYLNRVYYLRDSRLPFHYEFSGIESLNHFIAELTLQNERKELIVSTKINKLDCCSKVILRSIESNDKINKKKLKTFFQKNAVPAWQRKYWPVIELESTDKLIVIGCNECSDYDLDENFSTFLLGYSQRLKLGAQ